MCFCRSVAENAGRAQVCAMVAQRGCYERGQGVFVELLAGAFGRVVWLPCSVKLAPVV